MWPIAAAGVVLLLVGASAYAGFGKPIVVTMWPKPYLAFGLAWLGLAALLMALGTTLIDSGPEALGVVFSLLALVCFAITLLSFFWLPRRLLPGWYRAWVDGGRSTAQASRWPKFGRGGQS
ncbi:MAG: hypothetical protein QOF10_742 [Kribbellaceae bacterium]|jgi:hypothetical protein|nr:hypothetical protein [Kribbellaceae bacterium]